MLCIDTCSGDTAGAGGGEPKLSSVFSKEAREIGPILVCSVNEIDYRVYLAFKDDTEELTEENVKDKITLKVVESKWYGWRLYTRIVWGPNVKEQDKWQKWEIHMMKQPNDSKAKVFLQTSDPKKGNGFGPTAQCNKENKIRSWQWSGVSDNKKFWEVEKGEVTDAFKLSFERQNCKPNKSNKQECEIKFKGGNFEWEGGFKPTIIVSSK